MVKWTSKDLKIYQKEESYFDTILLPLVPVNFTELPARAAEKTEFSALVADELERNLAGRVLLAPPFTYLSAEDDASERLLSWEAALSEKFRHILCITGDESWKNSQLPDHTRLVWVPPLPVNDMDEPYLKKLLEEQTNQIMNILLQLWRQ